MKAYEIRDPKGIDSLNLVDRPNPRPGHGEVLIRVRATSLNYRDLALIRGGLAGMMKLPLVPLRRRRNSVVCLLYRSRWISSTSTPSGAWTKAILVPEVKVTGSTVKWAPLSFSSAAAASRFSTVKPMCSKPK